MCVCVWCDVCVVREREKVSVCVCVCSISKRQISRKTCTDLWFVLQFVFLLLFLSFPHLVKRKTRSAGLQQPAPISVTQ